MEENIHKITFEQAVWGYLYLVFLNYKPTTHNLNGIVLYTLFYPHYTIKQLKYYIKIQNNEEIYTLD